MDATNLPLSLRLKPALRCRTPVPAPGNSRATPQAYAAHRAIHPHPAHPARLLPVLAQSPRVQASRLPPALTPAAPAASRLHAPAALPAAHRPDRRTDAHSGFHAKTARARVYLQRHSECSHPKFRAATSADLHDPSPP